MISLELPALIVDAFSTTTTTDRLLLLNRDPAPGERDVAVDGALAFELVDTGTDGIDRAPTRVWVDDVLAFDAGNPTDAFNGPLASATQTSDALRVVLHPRAALTSLAAVTIRVSTQLTGGAVALDTQYSFFAEDRTSPRLLAAQAMAPKVVRVAFDEGIVLPPSASFSLLPRSAPAVPVRVMRASVDRTIALLELDIEMTPDAQYELRVEGVIDEFGNAVGAPYDNVTFVGFRPPRPPTRRFDLWSLVPASDRRDDQTGDLYRLIACLQEVTDLLLADLDRWPDTFDLERAAEAFVDLILRDLGNPFPFDLDVAGKRRLASVLIAMYRQVGTAKGIQNAVRFFLGIEISAISAFNVDTLYLGEAELGVDWVLGPSDRHALYAFEILVARVLSDVERRQIRAIVEYMKPGHTHFVNLVEPSSPPPVLDHWELGLSELPDTTILGTV